MFEEFSLDHRVLKAVEKLGFTKPSTVQAKALPLALLNKDLKVSAETGSGKTLAYLIPAIEKFLKDDAHQSGTRGLILVPTRELARQVYKAYQQMTRFTHLKAVIIVGGEEFKYQKALLRKNPEMIIATPGRLLEHLEKGNAGLHDLELLVIDEADRLLELGFHDDVETIATCCQQDRQTLFFSATLKPEKLSALADKLLRTPETLLLNSRRDQQQHIEQQHILADDKKHKQNLVDFLLKNESYKKCLIFTNTKAECAQLDAFLRYKKHHSATLHGDMEQPDRKQVIDQFRSGNLCILVATDIASRGLDIEDVDLIINFDMARTVDDHIHRIGRTGRAGETGVAISLVGANDWTRYTNVERATRQILSRRAIPGLEAAFTGIKKKKISAAKLKAMSSKSSSGGKSGKKAKQRARNQKNIGKPKRTSRKDRQNSDESSDESPSERIVKSMPEQGGFSPLKRKRKTDNASPSEE